MTLYYWLCARLKIQELLFKNYIWWLNQCQCQPISWSDNDYKLFTAHCLWSIMMRCPFQLDCSPACQLDWAKSNFNLNWGCKSTTGKLSVHDVVPHTINYFYPICSPHQQSMCGVSPPNSSHNQESMCGVPPSQYMFVPCGVPPHVVLCLWHTPLCLWF